jgi:hypothetical protein
MPNMSHCRFENTLADLLDCHDALAAEDWNVIQLSESEKKAKHKLLALCKRITREYDDDPLDGEDD